MQGVVGLQRIGFAVVDPVAVPVVIELVWMENSLRPGEKAKAATIVARYRACCSTMPLITGLPEGVLVVVVVVVADVVVVVVAVVVVGGVGIVTVAGDPGNKLLPAAELGILNRGNVSVS